MAIRTRTRELAAVEGGDARIEDYLDEKGLTWEFLPSVDPESFDVEKSLRNQARLSTPLDEKRVEEYTEAMKRGDKFPPVLAHGPLDRLIIADGNHRIAAAIKARRALAVYRVEGDARTIVAITFEANARHGLPTSEEEKVQHGLFLIDNGANIKDAAAALSLPKRVLDKAYQQRQAKSRFEQNGIPAITVDKLPATARNRLSNITTDEGFVAAVDLTVRANLTWEEVATLVTEINELRSSDKQVAYVRDQTEFYRERIQASAGGTFSRRAPGPKARMNQALGTIVHLDDLDAIVSQYVGPERDEAAKKMRAAARRLNELARSLSS